MDRIKVLFFGELAELTATSQLEVSGPLLLSELREELERNYPTLKDRVFQVAVNKRLATGKEQLNNGDEVAFLPPFAGG